MSFEIRHLVLHPPNWLGDVVMALPAMQALSQGIKAERISMIGQPWLAELLPFLSFKRVRYCKDVPADADMGVLFTNNFRSAWRLWRAGVPERIGFRGQWRRMLLTNAPKAEISMASEHHRAYFLNLAEQVGFTARKQEAVMQMSEQEVEDGTRLLCEHGLNEKKTVCIAPGAQFGEAKRYPVCSYNRVLLALHKLGWDLLILGTKAERGIAEQCLAGVEGRFWNASGETSLRQAIQLLGASRVLLCNDSGLMHVSAALGNPTVAMFGATDPGRTAPSGKRVSVLYEPAECSPCLRRECSMQEKTCMVNITSESVLKACLKWLP